DLEQWQAKEPMIRIRKCLEACGLWDAQRPGHTEQRVRETAREVTRQAGEIEPAPPQCMFNYVYARLPEQLKRQRDTMRTDSIAQDPQQIGLQRTAQAPVPLSPPTQSAP